MQGLPSFLPPSFLLDNKKLLYFRCPPDGLVLTPFLALCCHLSRNAAIGFIGGTRNKSVSYNRIVGIWRSLRNWINFNISGQTFVQLCIVGQLSLEMPCMNRLCVVSRSRSPLSPLTPPDSRSLISGWYRWYRLLRLSRI